MKTIRGIYYNLNESEYYYTDKESSLTFFFSSRLYLEKFISRIEEHYKDNLCRVYAMLDLDMKESKIFYKESLLSLYRKIEKRGFRVEKDVRTNESI